MVACPPTSAASPQDTYPVLTLDFVLVGTAGWAGNMAGQTPASSSELFLSEASTFASEDMDKHGEARIPGMTLAPPSAGQHPRRALSASNPRWPGHTLYRRSINLGPAAYHPSSGLPFLPPSGTIQTAALREQNPVTVAET